MVQHLNAADIVFPLRDDKTSIPNEKII